MTAINNFFIFLGKMIPFATDFFSGTFHLGPLEISNLFAIAVGLVVLLLLLIIIVAASAKGGRSRGSGRVPKGKAPNAAQPRSTTGITPNVTPTAGVDEDSEYLAPLPTRRSAARPTEEADMAVYGGITQQTPDNEETDEGVDEVAATDSGTAQEATVVEANDDSDTLAPVPDLVDIELPAAEAASAEAEETDLAEGIEAPTEEAAVDATEEAASDEDEAANAETTVADAETIDLDNVDEAVLEEPAPMPAVAAEAESIVPPATEGCDPTAEENTEITPAEQPQEELTFDEEDATESVAATPVDGEEEAEPLAPIFDEDEQQPAQEEAMDAGIAEGPRPTEAALEETIVPETTVDGYPARAIIDETPDENAQETTSATIDTPRPATAAAVPDTNENQPTKEEPMKEEKEKKAKEPEKKEPKKTAEANLVGKFEISLAVDGYRFCLYANNGQLMYESVGFVSIEGCKKGIETFRKTLREMPYSITRDKRGRYRFVFNKKYQGETYPDKPSATRAAESVKRWGADAKVVVNFPTDEEMQAYQERLNAMRDKSDVDWDAVAKEEASVKKSGKFVIEAEMNGDEIYGYRFYLLANNAQILYTSALYASPATATSAIDAFKRAVYIGNFYIDEDKTKHFRYILRGNNITYVGESYTNKLQAEKSVESVKNFVKSAQIVPYTPDAE